MVTYDVIIVGAGISGVYAGSILRDSGVDSLLVLEGRDRIAGRQWTLRESDVKYADLGGAYVGPQQTKILEVIKDLGLQTYNVGGDTNHSTTLAVKGSKQTFTNGRPYFWNPCILLDMNNVVKLIDKLSQEVSVEAPWEAEEAEKWDKISVKDFLQQKCWTRIAYSAISKAVQTIMMTDCADISFLYLLQLIHCLGGWDAATNIRNGLQAMKVKGGSDSISQRLAEKLHGQIHLNTYVTKIRDKGDEVILETDSHHIYKCKQLILAVPVPVLHLLTFDPPLPAYLQHYAAPDPKSYCIKTYIYYAEQFWTKQGLNGELMSESGPVQYAIDDTKPDGSYPAIMGFISAGDAIKCSAMTKQERQDLICKQYAREFGMAEFNFPVSYMEKYWHDEQEKKYSRGCCVHSLPPGVLTSVRRLPGESVGRLHFAGTETARTQHGYMDGALRTAQRAAQEVLKVMGQEVPEKYSEDLVNEEITFLPPHIIETLLPNVPQFIAILFTAATILCGVLLGYFH